MRLNCFTCGKVCSNEVPDDTILRGTVTCPECTAKEPDWEPISTAPRDGTLILLYNVCWRDYVTGDRGVDIGKFHPDLLGGVWYLIRGLNPVEPTHWKPIGNLPRE